MLVVIYPSRNSNSNSFIFLGMLAHMHNGRQAVKNDIAVGVNSKFRSQKSIIQREKYFKES